MTGGTTVTEFARLLLDRDGLTVVTNALNIASDLVANPGLRVFAAGGEVRSSSHESVRSQCRGIPVGLQHRRRVPRSRRSGCVAGCTNYDPVRSAGERHPAEARTNETCARRRHQDLKSGPCAGVRNVRRSTCSSRTVVPRRQRWTRSVDKAAASSACDPDGAVSHPDSKSVSFDH